MHAKRILHILERISSQRQYENRHPSSFVVDGINVWCCPKLADFHCDSAQLLDLLCIGLSER